MYQINVPRTYGHAEKIICRGCLKPINIDLLGGGVADSLWWNGDVKGNWPMLSNLGNVGIYIRVSDPDPHGTGSGQKGKEMNE